MLAMWHRVGKERGRAVLSGGKADQPGRGVWIKDISTIQEQGYSKEAIAVDGRIVHVKNCYCGQDRNTAWTIAGDYLFGRRNAS